MTHKHTPGQWRCDSFGVVTGGLADCTSVCTTTLHQWQASAKINPDVDGMIDEARANGRLIASAPDLLAALQDMEDMFARRIDGRLGPDDASARWDAARDAIAKATGVAP